MERVAFIGLGTMGAGMAGRLLEAGYRLTVFNRHAERAAALVERGAQLATSPREAAAQADVVIAMVSDDAASRETWLGPDGALAGARPGTIAIDSSTLTTGWVRELAADARARQCDFLEAPVTGSRPQAAAGELTFLVGGDAATLERVRPLFAPMSRAILHLGPNGSGALLKLINNFLCGVQAASLAEAVALIEASGLDRDQALAFLANGTPGSPMIKGISSRMVARTYEVFFKLRLMHKDLSYALAEAAEHGVELNTVVAALERFGEAKELGWGEHDLSAVAEAVRGSGSRAE